MKSAKKSAAARRARGASSSSSQKTSRSRSRARGPHDDAVDAPAVHVVKGVDADGPARTPGELLVLLRERLEIVTPGVGLIEGASTPLDYLVHTFFEGRRFGPVEDGAAIVRGPADCCVWANRGGGKTFLGAVATLLDIVFKPGIEVRILGGSLGQSQRMHEHLRRLVSRPEVAHLLTARSITDKRIRLANGSRAEIMAQSQASVRGTRVQKVRCDEVELFKTDVWDAAQLTTRAMKLAGPWGDHVRGSVEALSTMHRPMGLMWRVVCECEGGTEALSFPVHADAPDVTMRARMASRSETRQLFRWGVVDVLEHCPVERVCATCGLQEECAGRAKARAPEVAGHFHIEDALRAKCRVSVAQWRSEMLCARPSRSDSVYPEFDPQVHVFAGEIDSPCATTRDALDPLASSPFIPITIRGLEPATLVCGMDFGLRSPTAILWALLSEDGMLRVIDESVVENESTASHVERMISSNWGRPAWVGIDPAGGNRSEQTLLSASDLLGQAGLVVRDKRISIHAGVRLVQARLAPALFRVRASSGQPGMATRPRLIVHSRCVKLIEALTRYHYDPDQPHSTEPVKDGPDHVCDALRYMVLNIDARVAAGKGYQYT